MMPYLPRIIYGQQKKFKAVFIVSLFGSTLACLACGDVIEETPREQASKSGIKPLPPRQNDPDTSQVELGKALFFDKILSGNRDTSCASCHNPNFNTIDAQALAAGTKADLTKQKRLPGENRVWTRRNSQSLMNLGVGETGAVFWDGRIWSSDVVNRFVTPIGNKMPKTLQDPWAIQALLPITKDTEMLGQPGDASPSGKRNELAEFEGQETKIWDHLLDRLRSIGRYRILFNEAFPDSETAINIENFGRALSIFQRVAFRTTSSPFGNYLDGNDDALTESQVSGARLFFGKANCVTCHDGKKFSDRKFYNIGVPRLTQGVQRDEPDDTGRMQVTGNVEHEYSFRTPTLWNVAQTAPYMHNGVYETLHQVIEHHSHPERKVANLQWRNVTPLTRRFLNVGRIPNRDLFENLSPKIRQVPDLSESEVRQLVDFLFALNGREITPFEEWIPETVPSGIPVEPISRKQDAH